MERKYLLAGAAVASLGLAGGVVAGATYVRSRALAWVDAELNRSVDAVVTHGDVDVSLLSSFPRVAVTVKDLKVAGKGAFEGVELASVPSLSVAVDAFSLLGGGPIEIVSLVASDPAVHLVVDEQGKANWDVTLPSDPGAPASSYHATLRRIDVQGLSVAYDDRQGGTTADVRGLTLEGSGDVTEDVLSLDTTASVDALTAAVGGITYLKDSRWKMAGKIAVDQNTSRLTFDDARIDVNALPLALTGWFEPREDGYAMSMDVNAADTSFKTLLSLIPSAYSSSFADVDAAGTLAFHATASGLYASEGDHLPKLDLALKVADGKFKYPDLPTSVDGIALDVVVDHPEGAADLAVIDVRDLTFTTAGAPFEGHAKIAHPATDPDVDAKLKGRVDLGALQQALPPSDTKYAGAVDMDLDVAGRMSAFQSQDVDHVRADGWCRMAGVTYESPELPVPVTFDHVDVAMSPKAATLNDVRLRFGKSDLQVTGAVGGLLPYALADGTLTGDLTATGDVLDLTPFESDSSTSAGTTSAAPSAGTSASSGTSSSSSEAVIVPVPKNLALSVKTKLGKVYVDELELSDVTGTAKIADGAVALDHLKMGLLGGDLTMSGRYEAATDDHADVDFDVDAVRFDIPKVVQTFVTVAKLVPVAEAASGHLDSAFGLKARLLRDGTPDTSSLFSKGRLQTKQVGLSTPTLAKIGAALKDDKYGKMQFDGIPLDYLLDGGQLKLDQAPCKIGGVPCKLSGGAHVMDETVDLAIDFEVPTAGLAGTPLLAGLATVPKTVPVRATITGPWNDPKVSVDLQALGQQAVDVVKEAASGAIDDLVAQASAQGDALIAQAEKAGDALRAQAKTAADAVRSEADKQAKQLVAQGKGNPVSEAAAKTAAQKLRDEADKKATKLEKEADRKADDGVAAAKKKKDQLIADAQAKAKARLK